MKFNETIQSLISLLNVDVPSRVKSQPIHCSSKRFPLSQEKYGVKKLSARMDNAIVSASLESFPLKKKTVFLLDISSKIKQSFNVYTEGGKHYVIIFRTLESLTSAFESFLDLAMLLVLTESHLNQSEFEVVLEKIFMEMDYRYKNDRSLLKCTLQTFQDTCAKPL